MNAEKNFLGTGWRFPVGVDKVTGRIAESSYEEKIAQSIQLILRTRPGERVMRPTFGCNLQRFVFSEMNYTVMQEIEGEVRQALILWEPRIIEVSVTCKPQEGQSGVLLIEISYVVRSTNNPYNLVYPFYLGTA